MLYEMKGGLEAMREADSSVTVPQSCIERTGTVQRLVSCFFVADSDPLHEHEIN
jgi:hypothetical protein